MSFDRCEQCPGKSRVIGPSGPVGARVLLVGEAGGLFEERVGKPFVGDSGKELDRTYLPRAGMDRADVRVTNTVLCRPDNNKKPGDGLIACCSRFHLPQEIAECDPRVIVLLGATACSLLPEIKLEIEHGRPFNASVESTRGTVLEGWSGVICPMYHPASGLHDTRTIQAMCEDWTYLGEWLNGKHRAYLEVRKHYHYNWEILPIIPEFGMSIDLESVDGKVWSIQMCPTPGKVWMWTVDWLVGNYLANPDRSVLGWMQGVMGARVILHNAPGDLKLLAQLGLEPQAAVFDTMVCSYHRQNLPQGLKALGYRLFGIRMREYSDLVIPASKRKLEEWITQALIICENELRTVELKQLKTKVKEITHVSGIEKALRRILTHTLGKDGYDSWSRLADCELDLAAVVGRIGDYPRQSIEHVGQGDVVDYACEDASVTMMLAHWLEEHRDVGLAIADGDEDQ